MEETLGKRIVSNRKRLGITQDRLAEQLGVTAQAVSKWENDQSCPDISTLPKLAEIFGVTIDSLLGCEQPQIEKVHEAELVAPEEEPLEHEYEGLYYKNGKWEFRYDGGRKSNIALAVWVLLVGGLLLASNILGWDAAIWSILWPTGLLVFGLFGLYPKFSVFRLGCALAGGYFLLTNLGIGVFARIGAEYILPVGILLFGLSLLIDALRRPKWKDCSIHHNGKGKHCTSIDYGEDSFECCTVFGGNMYQISLSRLLSGTAEVSFGELTVDLRGVEEVAENCRIKADCSFGNLTLLVPKHYTVNANPSTAFASLEYKGQPAPDPRGVINLDADISFGQVTVQYI